jgi:hypothetical protein
MESKNIAVHVFFFIFSLYLCTQARLREPECRCSGATFVGKTLALAIIQDVPKLAGRKNNTVIMVTPTEIVGVFLFSVLGFLQVPGTSNGDSSTFCVHTGACRNRFVWWLGALIRTKTY